MSDLAPIPDSHLDLLSAPGTAALTTVGADGYPQTTAIWYLLDRDVVRTSLHRSRQKYRNLAARPQATLFVIDPANPGRTIELRAEVTIEDAPDTSFLERLLAHYGSTLDTFPAPTDDRVVVTLTPRRVVAIG